VVGLVNAAGLRPGDTVYADDPVRFPPLPRFAPEHSRWCTTATPPATSSSVAAWTSSIRRAWCKVLRRVGQGDQAPIMAAVGPMQLEVAKARMEGEFGAPIEVAPARSLVARETDAEGAARLARLGIEMLERRSGELWRCSAPSTTSTACSVITPR